MTGLVAGGISCLAVQGGLLATAISGTKSRFLGVTGFLVAKLFAYALLGLGLGAVGSVFLLSARTFGVLQLVAAIYMLGVAGAILEIHPIFRYFIIQTPRFLTKMVRNESKSRQLFAPVILGVLTVLIPCGATQAMMTQAISSGSAIQGFLVMSVFVLGTMPLFFLLGFGFASIGEVGRGRLAKLSGLAVLGIALWNLNSSAIVLGSPIYAQKVWATLECEVSFCAKADASLFVASDQITVNIERDGYHVSNQVIKAGKPVTLTLTNAGATGCQQAFTIPSLNVSQIVGVGASTKITFVAPDKPGTLAYSCGMGMYPGELTVVN